VRYVSHEIRTPLNTVKMGTQLARSKLAESNLEDATEILEDVEASCETAIEVLNDLLLYDKIEDGGMELDKTNISALILVTNVTNLLEVQVCRNIKDTKLAKLLLT
jgi:signal transduction histidine kinase